MSWIILTQKLPVRPSPPKLSIHWSTPWPLEEEAKRQKEAFNRGFFLSEEDEQEPKDDILYGDLWPHGKEHNAAKAVKIHYKDSDIRVWAAECNVLTAERMRAYVFGLPGEDIPSHELVANRTETDALLLRAAMETDLQSIYDAALLDGCIPEMAQMVAMGIEIEDASLEFPPIGWYRCKPEFAAVYCYEDELEEE